MRPRQLYFLQGNLPILRKAIRLVKPPEALCRFFLSARRCRPSVAHADDASSLSMRPARGLRRGGSSLKEVSAGKCRRRVSLGPFNIRSVSLTCQPRPWGAAAAVGRRAIEPSNCKRTPRRSSTHRFGRQPIRSGSFVARGWSVYRTTRTMQARNGGCAIRRAKPHGSRNRPARGWEFGARS